MPYAPWSICKSIRVEGAPFAATLQSPLTDSNRRPPPYHIAVSATGRNPRQRFWLVSALFSLGAFATVCRWLRPLGSTNAPSSKRVREALFEGRALAAAPSGGVSEAPAEAHEQRLADHDFVG
jgi:hypothetical protein